MNILKKAFTTSRDGFMPSVFSQLDSKMSRPLSCRQELEEFVSLRMASCLFTDIEAPVKNVQDLLVQHFDINNRPAEPLAEVAVATLLGYLYDTVRTDLTHLSQLTRLDYSENLVVDTCTLRNLEITRNLRDGGKKDTLLDVLDFTHTAMGTRLLKKWQRVWKHHVGFAGVCSPQWQRAVSSIC